MVGGCPSSESGCQAFLDGKRDRLVVVAEKVKAVDIVPRLVCRNVAEDAAGLVLESGSGLGLALRVDVVVEDLLGRVGANVISLRCAC